MKKLIIVCEEKLRRYGDFLSQLVSLQDDKGDDVIGVKDGAVAAQVWTEKEYTANAPQISSEQYILFLGNSKMMKEKRAFMQERFSQYGMCYCWLGKQAAVFVEHVVSIEEYNGFIALAQGNLPEVKKLIETKKDLVNTDVLDTVVPAKKGFHDLIAPVKGVIDQGIKQTKKAANNKKIEEQQYSCLTLIFYLEGLAAFLGLNEQ